jgi:hypothetical protein
LARLTREYTDGGANICAELTRFSSAKNLFFADENEILFICAAIHSAVRVFTGEADEIAVQSCCGFCVKILKAMFFAYCQLLGVGNKFSPLA